MILDRQEALARNDHAALAGGPVTVATRFGTFDFTADQTFYMPRGPHGFTDYHLFGLANLPEPAPKTFKLLQSLDDPELSFIVVAFDPASGAITAQHLSEAAGSLSIAVADAVFLLIVTLRPAEGGTTATVNLRAPLVLDLDRRIASQVVFADSAYPIQQPL